MSSYVKLFGSILGSTVWQTSSDTRVVWITLMALADRDGIAEASIPGLAKIAGVQISECERALSIFMSPDPYSRTKEKEGRRIEEVDGGWRLLNHEKYREKQSLLDRQQNDAARQQRKRDREKSVTRHVTSTKSRFVTASDADTYAASEAASDPKSDQKKHRADKPASPAAVSVLGSLNAARKKAIPGARAIGANPASLEHIEARLKDGYTVEDCQHVIAVCAADVRHSPDTAKWFNTVTPFRRDNFARKLGGDPDSAIATGHARAPTYGDIEQVGDTTHLLGDYMPKGTP